MKRLTRSALALALCAVLLLSFPAGAKTAETDVFYPQISDYAKEVYDRFRDSQVMESFRTGESFSLTFNGPFGDAQSAVDALANAAMEAFAAFDMDHPEMFWLQGSSVSVSGSSSRVTMTMTPDFHSSWATGERSVSADSAAVTEAVQRIAAEARAQGGVYEQLLYAHDWLTAHNYYNLAAAAAGTEADYLPWTPLSALTDESQPVCEGYAAAFKLLCDELGIPCLVVVGYALSGGALQSHDWNTVKLGGRWYAVDTTFDDPSSGADKPVSGHERHDYFLVGAQTVIGGNPFADSHRPTGEKMAGFVFRYPELAAEAYEYTGEEEETVEPEEPDGPAPIVRKDIPLTGTAVERTQTVTVGDEQVVLTAYALLDEQGNPTNYVRLRDLAALLDGTAAEFDVLWSRETGIRIEPRHPYDHPNGSEGSIPFTGDQPYAAYPEDTLVDGMALPLTAFQISWEGGSHTFYQLRDLGRALNFNVGWTGARGLFIEPDRPYTDED